MKVETVHLKEHYPILGAEGKDPLLVCYMPDNLTEMGPDNKRHRAMVVCPCDGYAMVSQREAEPIALNLMAMDFYVFMLTYSVVPHAFPSQIREVASMFDYIHRYADKWHVGTLRQIRLFRSLTVCCMLRHLRNIGCPPLTAFPVTRRLQKRNMFPIGFPLSKSGARSILHNRKTSEKRI